LLGLAVLGLAVLGLVDLCYLYVTMYSVYTQIACNMKILGDIHIVGFRIVGSTPCVRLQYVNSKCVSLRMGWLRLVGS